LLYTWINHKNFKLYFIF